MTDDGRDRIVRGRAAVEGHLVFELFEDVLGFFARAAGHQAIGLRWGIEDALADAAKGTING